MFNETEDSATGRNALNVDSEYDQYRHIKRGDIHLLEQLDSQDFWNTWEWKDGVLVRAFSYRRSVYRARVYGNKFIAIRYHGRDAEKIWKELTKWSNDPASCLFGIHWSRAPIPPIYERVDGHDRVFTIQSGSDITEHIKNPSTNGSHEQGQTMFEQSFAPERTNSPPMNGNHEQSQAMFTQSSGIAIMGGRFNNVHGNQVNIENHAGGLYVLGIPQSPQFNTDQSAMLRLLENVGNTAMTLIGISYNQLLLLASSLELLPIELVLLLGYHTFEPQIIRLISETPVYQLLQ
ncbi:hypothetical protein Moror_14639 [Moniliophthora roreri MCA 2997]|uniref:Uncharacterized protein n=2 Tax=Moniliophthora roreri TaxID=221103 RepID=V2XL46_MONRO|nr:hypothetical protein Moror_14639 [Moniliophthora roreri MCA 2997]